MNAQHKRSLARLVRTSGTKTWAERSPSLATLRLNKFSSQISFLAIGTKACQADEMESARKRTSYCWLSAKLDKDSFFGFHSSLSQRHMQRLLLSEWTFSGESGLLSQNRLGPMTMIFWCLHCGWDVVILDHNHQKKHLCTFQLRVRYPRSSYPGRSTSFSEEMYFHPSSLTLVRIHWLYSPWSR